jgi:ribosome-binding ATPase YchF (GTP1/OBG family)
MAMKVGIAGFAGSGKSTVFQWLTGVKPDPSKVQSGQTGHAPIPDPRLDWLFAHFKPKRNEPVYASIDFLDTPGLLHDERRDNPRRLAIMREAGGLLVVLNGFSGSQPAQELKQFREELFFADLEIITKRIDKLGDQLKKPRPGKQKELDQAELTLLQRIAAGLEQGKTPADLGIKGEEEKMIRSFQLLTLKAEMVLLNVGDSSVGQALPPELLQLSAKVIAAPAKLEVELLELSEEDRQVFMKDLGVTGFSREDVLRQIFTGMGMIVFFTVGEDECRAWAVHHGADAVEGASQIHTDLARGFVRAEVVSYADFQRVKSMKEAKSHGVYRLEGKTYIVQDADIMHILAST